MLQSTPLDDRLTVTSVTRLSEFLNLSKILKGLFGYALIVSIHQVKIKITEILWPLFLHVDKE